MTRAWAEYAIDNQDELVGASRWVLNNRTIPDWTGGNWLGLIPPEDPNNWEESFVRQSPLFPYTGNNLSMWICPADPSSGQKPTGENVRRTRSYSLNCWVGGPGWDASGPWWPKSSTQGVGWRVYRKSSDFLAPGPARTIAFLDQRADSIANGSFIIDMKGFPEAPESATMMEHPGHFHENGGNLSFADGHVELWRWSDPRTTPPYRGVDIPLLQSPNNPDLLRLQSGATRYYEPNGSVRFLTAP
ncbi:MAG: H-X9-DG-CTERM domain-containing protein [Verrucomicrobiota bacterium]